MYHGNITITSVPGRGVKDLTLIHENFVSADLLAYILYLLLLSTTYMHSHSLNNQAKRYTADV